LQTILYLKALIKKYFFIYTGFFGITINKPDIKVNGLILFANNLPLPGIF